MAKKLATAGSASAPKVSQNMDEAALQQMAQEILSDAVDFNEHQMIVRIPQREGLPIKEYLPKNTSEEFNFKFVYQKLRSVFFPDSIRIVEMIPRKIIQVPQFKPA